MAPNTDELQAQVGESKQSVTNFRIEAGKVEEFARAIGDDNPVYRDEAVARARGLPSIPAPPTFTRVSMFPRYRPEDAHRLGFDVGFDVRREIHGEQAYEFERPVFVGDVLDARTTLTDAFQREGSRGGTMTFAILETEFRDAEGDLVVTERSTLIETEAAIEDDETDEPADEADETREKNESDDAIPPRIGGATVSQAATGHDDPLAIDEVSEGDTAFELTVENVTRPDFVRYAGASGDFNPIHYDEQYARSLGNPRVFGQGMLTAGYASHFATDWFGVATLRRFETRFLARMWPGDTVTFTGTVRDVDADAGTVIGELVGERGTGELLIEGEVAAVLPSRE